MKITAFNLLVIISVSFSIGFILGAYIMRFVFAQRAQHMYWMLTEEFNRLLTLRDDERDAAAKGNPQS